MEHGDNRLIECAGCIAKCTSEECALDFTYIRVIGVVSPYQRSKSNFWAFPNGPI